MPRKPTNPLTPDQLLNKIRKSGKQAARDGRTCHDKETLKVKRGYTDEQADAYISAFNETAGTPQEQVIKKVRKAAQAAAAHGTSCPTKEVLLKKGYTVQAADAYLSAYEAAKGTDEKQTIRKARQAAQAAATHGVPCPTKEALIIKGYNKQTLDTYLSAYQASKGTDEEQAIRRARTAAQVAAAKGVSCMTKEALIKSGYTEKTSDAYLSAYQATKGTDEEQTIRKARTVAQVTAAHGAPCLTKEELIKKGYTEQASEVYFTTYEKSKKSKTTRLTKEQELQLQSLLNQSSEINDYSCIASFLDSLGYEESTSLLLTEQDEQYLAELLDEEVTNSNGLLFNFNSAETTSLTTSGFLSSFDEVGEMDASTDIYNLR
ncbi:hypothetical protein [Candidatus Berkiella aquae]|uniref:Uncharacterized protein n=1 Tax=Candidatus Berkiella aquae TaxID=295108 RepID=A0A0Q9YUQ8_9GAMM|nr:hypothetical protein [Candidatus Berkiella aquae]MCS5711390.1 hypothetical protein [Candidatus Berkiella aquae]